jgi:hypothetical protein
LRVSRFALDTEHCDFHPASEPLNYLKRRKGSLTILPMRDSSLQLDLAEKLPAMEPQLVRQAHGGALLRGGMPGHRGGGGRPKELLRAQMRTMLREALAAMHAALRGERLAQDAGAELLADPRVRGLPIEAQRTIADAARTHLTARLSHRELIQLGAELAKYGVGTQDERYEESTVKYIVRLPSRVSRPKASPGPIAVVDAEQLCPTHG